MKKDVNKHITIWYMLGRVAPIGALFLLCIALIFDVEGWLEYILCAIGTLFANVYLVVVGFRYC